MKAKIFAPVLALGLLLAQGCARVPGPEPVSWREHREALAMLREWRLEAKLGYRTAVDAGSVSLDWTQHGASAEVWLRGPFGAGSAQILAGPAGAVLRQPGEAERRAASVEALSQALLGWPLPARELGDWVLGIPYRGAAVDHLALDPQGRLRELRQNGWTLVFADYRQTTAGFLPGRIDAQGDRLRIRLVAKRWEFAAP